MIYYRSSLSIEWERHAKVMEPDMFKAGHMRALFCILLTFTHALILVEESLVMIVSEAGISALVDVWSWCGRSRLRKRNVIATNCELIC